MSKIFDAYRKKVGDTADLGLEISRAGAVSLYSSPADSQMDDFNKLSSRVLGLRRDDRGVVLAFASSASNEGASFVSYNTAVFLAKTYEQHVVWIDGNFLSPQKKLLEHGQETLSSLLREPDRVDDLVFAENPLLIAGGSDLIGVKGLFADQSYGNLLAALASRFDFVILDLPPVLGTTDTALMAAGADGFLLIIEQQFLKREVIGHGLRSLREKNVRLLGSVINRRSYALPKVIYNRL